MQTEQEEGAGLMTLQVTYYFDDKKAFGQSIVDVSPDLPFWFCFRLLLSAYFGRTPGQATATLQLTDVQERQALKELDRYKKEVSL